MEDFLLRRKLVETQDVDFNSISFGFVSFRLINTEAACNALGGKDLGDANESATWGKV